MSISDIAFLAWSIAATRFEVYVRMRLMITFECVYFGFRSFDTSFFYGERKEDRLNDSYLQ